MINNKLSSTQIVLVVVVLTVLSIIAYFVMPTPPIAVQPTLSPAITSALTPDPTSDINISDWRTYRNESNGFEIKYPLNPEWVANESKIANPEAIKPIKSIINFSLKGKVYIQEESKVDPISIIVINGTLEDYYQVYAKSPDVIEEKVLINNLSFIHQVDEKWGVTSFKIQYPKKNLSYIITNYVNGLTPNVSEKKLLNNTFNQMLFTFKFIN